MSVTKLKYCDTLEADKQICWGRFMFWCRKHKLEAESWQHFCERWEEIEWVWALQVWDRHHQLGGARDSAGGAGGGRRPGETRWRHHLRGQLRGRPPTRLLQAHQHVRRPRVLWLLLPRDYAGWEEVAGWGAGGFTELCRCLLEESPGWRLSCLQVLGLDGPPGALPLPGLPDWPPGGLQQLWAGDGSPVWAGQLPDSRQQQHPRAPGQPDRQHSEWGQGQPGRVLPTPALSGRLRGHLCGGEAEQDQRRRPGTLCQDGWHIDTKSRSTKTVITDIEPGTIISFYNGVKVRSEGDWERPTPYKMLLDENNDIVIINVISNWTVWQENTQDIPDSMTSLQSYSATLGHKVTSQQATPAHLCSDENIQTYISR